MEKWISYVSDAKGRYQLVLRDQLAEKEPQYIDLGSSTMYMTPAWSPDSKKLTYVDTHVNLYYIDIDTKEPVLVASDKDASTTGRAGNSFSPSWSPDSNWIAYTKAHKNGVRGIFVYNLVTRQEHAITDGMSAANTPVYTRDGKYLFFQASTNTGLSNSGLHMTSYDRAVEYHLYAFILSKDTPSLFKPESDEEPVKDGDEKKEEPAKKESVPTVKIDFDGHTNRILVMPVRPGFFGQLNGLVDGKITYTNGGEIKELDLKTLKENSLVTGASQFRISADGKKMMYASRGNYYIVDAGRKPSSADLGKLDLSGIKVLIDPAAEWANIYDEVWRMQKEYFYVENMHGLDWEATKKKYAKFLPFVNHRNDLNFVFGEMMGEMTVGHNYIRGGDLPSAANVGIGMLGADYAIENGAYRIKKIFSRLDWNPNLKAPLLEPGVIVSVGDYILAVDGRPLSASMNIYNLFENKVGKQVKLTVNSAPNMNGARDVIVVPISGGQETSMRRTEWEEVRRRKVDEMSNGTIAYLYMPNTGRGGYDSFNRYYFTQMDRKALIIDERNNGGGSVADYVIDLLSRELMTYWGIRDGKSFTTPGNGSGDLRR